MLTYYEPLLWTAASKGDLDGVNQYLALGASPNYQNPDKNYWPVIFAAISAQNIAVIKVLLAAGADVRLKDQKRLNAIQHALLRVGIQGTETFLPLLLAQPYTLTSDALLDTLTSDALLAAAATGNLEVLVQKYKSASLEVDLAGNTLAHYAAVNNQVEILQFLHDQGVDCYSKNTDGIIPLYAAFAKKIVGAVGYLLSIAPSYESLANSDGWPFLNVVSQYDNVEIFQLVRNRFPNLDINEPTDLYESDKGSIDSEGHYDDKKHNFVWRDKPRKVDNWNPLLVAVDFGCSTLIAYLIEQPGINLKCSLNDGRTALCLAAQNGHLPIVRALTSKEATDINQFNPLYFAARNGHFEIVLHLTSLPNIQLLQSCTGCEAALYAAIRQGHNKIAFLLISLLTPVWEALSKEQRTTRPSPDERMLTLIVFALELKRIEIFAEIMRIVEDVGGQAWMIRLFDTIMWPQHRNISTFKQMVSFVNVQAIVHNDCDRCTKPKLEKQHGCGIGNRLLHICAQAVWEEALLFLLSYGAPFDLKNGAGLTARDIMIDNKYQNAASQPICDAKNRLFGELRPLRHMKKNKKWPSLITLLIDYINRQAPNTLSYRGKRIEIQRLPDEEIQVHRFVPVFPFVPVLPNKPKDTDKPKDTGLPTPKKRITISLIFNEPSTPLLPKELKRKLELEKKLQYYFSGTFFSQSRTQALKASGSTKAEVVESSASAPVVVRV